MKSKIFRPRSAGKIKLSSPCTACAYFGGLIIIRDEKDPGFVRCGKCDSALYSIAEIQAQEVGK